MNHDTFVAPRSTECFTRPSRSRGTVLGKDAVEATAFLRNLCRLGDVQEYELRHLLIARYPFPGDATPENFDPIGRLGLAKAQAVYADWDRSRTV